jgi:hypothetical protein
MVDAHTVRLRRKSPFLEWCDAEGIPVVTGYGVEDLRSVPLRFSERLGAPVAYCHLEGGQGAFVAEIPPEKSLNPISHMYEEQILILEGQGATQFYGPVSKETITLEWQAGSLFSPPLNVKHQHFNGSGSAPVRFVAVNNAPLVFNTFRSAEFVFNNPYNFPDRFSGQAAFCSAELKTGEIEDTSVNFYSGCLMGATSLSSRQRGWFQPTGCEPIWQLYGRPHYGGRERYVQKGTPPSPRSSCYCFGWKRIHTDVATRR